MGYSHANAIWGGGGEWTIEHLRLNVVKGPHTRAVLPVPSRAEKKFSGPEGGRRRCWGVYVRQLSFHQIRHYTMHPGDFMWVSWVGGEVAA